MSGDGTPGLELEPDALEAQAAALSDAGSARHRVRPDARMRARTDDELASLDLTALLRRGLPDVEAGPARRQLFGDGAVCAAITLDRFGVLPRSVAFLAEIVRAGGSPYAAALAEPLPEPAASATMSAWLSISVQAAGDSALTARWLDAVAALIDMRRRGRDATT